MNTRYLLTFPVLCLLLSAFGFAVSRADCVTPPAGLIGWWRAENNALDHVGTHHGTMLNGATFAAGPTGQAFSFDGTNDVVQIPNAPDLNPATITIEAWVNPSTINQDSRIISKDLQAGSCTAPYVAYSLDIRGDQGGRAIFYFTTTNNALNQLSGTSVIPTGQFTHLAATYDGTTARLYVNGALESSLARTGPITTSATPLTIGNAGAACRASFAGQVEFAGMIDEVSLYNRALSASEIQAIFTAGSAGKCVGLALNIASLPGAVRLTWSTNATGYLLETNGALTLPAGWGVLTSNYSVLNTNFVVTNAIGGATRFYRLHKP